MSSWIRIALGVTAIALVLLGLAQPQRTAPDHVWLRWFPPIVVVLAAIGIIVPDAAIAQAVQPAVFVVAMVYAWFWLRVRRKGA